jgi:hypothetical protein
VATRAVHDAVVVDDQFHFERLEVEVAPALLRLTVDKRAVGHAVGDPVEQRRIRIASEA